MTPSLVMVRGLVARDIKSDLCTKKKTSPKQSSAIYKLTRLPSGMSCISYILNAKYSPNKVCVNTPSTCTSHHSQLTGKPAHSVVSIICTICTVALKSNTFLARSTAHTTATLLLL